MPPKAKKADGASKKTENKKKEKIIEDKTFGLKNKKGGKQQKFIKNVTNQVKCGSTSLKKLEQESKEKYAKKDAKKKEQDEMNLIFKPVQQAAPKGADPKSVVCAFYKQGSCGKGDKCKFSHDLAMERKGAKKNVYEDTREDADNMDDWDEAKLEEVVNKKHGETNKSMPATAIICRYFLDAVENNKYGWFWNCPNGTKCHYRHALPPGFALKKDQKKESKKDQISIEELIEKERASLGTFVTRITLESFLKWKERKRKEKIAQADAAHEKRKNDFKQGKMFGISGRELFEFNPDMVIDDDDEAEATIEREKDESDEEDDGVDAREINLDDLSRMASEVDGSGTKRVTGGTPNAGGDNDESNKLDMAGALPNGIDDETDAAIAAAVAATKDGDVLADDVPIDEDLFMDGDDIDLIAEDLETLDLEEM